MHCSSGAGSQMGRGAQSFGCFEARGERDGGGDPSVLSRTPGQLQVSPFNRVLRFPSQRRNWQDLEESSARKVLGRPGKTRSGLKRSQVQGPRSKMSNASDFGPWTWDLGLCVV